jgi:hypothetical protein
VNEAKHWFEKINISPVEKASERIWEYLDQIIDEKNL